MFRHTFQIWYEGEGGGGAGTGGGAPAGGAPTDGAASSAARPGGPGTGGGGAGSGPGAGAPAGGAPAPKSFTFQEDRTDWLPRDRYNSLNDKYRSMEAEHGRLRAMLEAGTGFKAPALAEPEDPRMNEARQFMFKLIPGLDKLLESREFMDTLREKLGNHVDNLAILGERGPALLSASDHTYESMGRRTVDAVYAGVSKAMGVQELNTFQQRTVGQSFIEYVRSDVKIANRYAKEDPSVITDFLKEYTGGFIDPLRRSAQAGPAGQASRNGRLPSAPRPGAPASGGRPAGPKTEKDVHQAAWETFTQAGQ